jgi:hypothetical protein
MTDLEITAVNYVRNHVLTKGSRFHWKETLAQGSGESPFWRFVFTDSQQERTILLSMEEMIEAGTGVLSLNIKRKIDEDLG